MKFFFDYTRQDYQSRFIESGISPAHAKNLFRNAYKKHAMDPWSHPDFPQSISEVGNQFPAPLLNIAQQQVSGYDSSVKFLFALQDGTKVESVLMPETNRITLCLSSQVGCAQGCVFCHTGRMGLTRNLSAGEIVAQVVTANRWMNENPSWRMAVKLPPAMRVSNVVFMGMGEPLDNVEAVIQSIKIMTDPYGLDMGPRHISVSTAGHLPGLKKLQTALPKVPVALSLHNADDEERSKIMPINRRWPIAQVIECIGAHQKQTQRPCLIQYTLIDGVNDSPKHAINLCRVLAPIDAKVNIIPLNPVTKMRLRAPEASRIRQFRDVLHGAGVRSMVRYSKGQDIAAACGQLAVNESQI